MFASFLVDNQFQLLIIEAFHSSKLTFQSSNSLSNEKLTVL